MRDRQHRLLGALAGAQPVKLVAQLGAARPCGADRTDDDTGDHQALVHVEPGGAFDDRFPTRRRRRWRMRRRGTEDRGWPTCWPDGAGRDIGWSLNMARADLLSGVGGHRPTSGLPTSAGDRVGQSRPRCQPRLFSLQGGARNALGISYPLSLHGPEFIRLSGQVPSVS